MGIYNGHITSDSSISFATFGSRSLPLSIIAGTGLSAAASNMSVSVQEQHIFVQGNGAPTTVTASPAIQAHTIVGAKMYIYGRSDANTVTFNNSSGSLELNGPAVLGASDVLSLAWDGTAWVQVGK